MDLKTTFFTIFITFMSIAWAANTCMLIDKRNPSCAYTILCEGRPGGVAVPDCGDREPHATLHILSTDTDYLNQNFFSSTNFDSKIRIFKAYHNKWGKLEPYVFRYYPKTEIIDIPGNKIRDIGSDAFLTLTALTSLNMSSNEIFTLSEKAFHVSDKTISKLHILDISHNSITELSNQVFSDAPNLTDLYLNNNKIETIADDCFTNNKEIANLYLDHNKLKSLNMILMNLKSLRRLDVSFNFITNLVGYDISRLVSLEFFKASNNHIATVDPICFQKALNLQLVVLRENRIKSIDNTTFMNNNQLNYLDLSKNNIFQIQDNTFKHNALIYVNLEGNNLNGDITEDTLSGLQNITILNLFNQNITNIKSYAFSNITDLVNLNLRQNNIRNINNTAFEKLNSLNILDISHNQLTNLDFLNNSLANLTELSLKNNNISQLTEYTFKNKTSLKKLDFSYNNISTFDQYSFPLTNLQYLDVTGNPLVGTLKSNVFSPAKLLRYLDLSHFKLSTIDEMAFVDLPVLARLNLSHNEIDYVDPNNFIGTNNLYSLDVSYNKLTCLYLNNSDLNNLQALYLNNNRLTNISISMPNMSRLTYLDISHNDITDLVDVDFSKSPNLQVLILSYNKIKTFNNPNTHKLFALTDLRIASNLLTNINLTYFKKLNSADLSNNNISIIDSTQLQNVNDLQFLDLSHNNLTELAPGTLRNMKTLKLLNVSHNNLLNLRFGTFNGLERTKSLDLSYNNIENVNVDVFHACTELNELIMDYNRIKSLDIIRLMTVVVRNLKIISLGGNQLPCTELIEHIRNASVYRETKITSIHQIHHEDNVHGIKCGNIYFNTSFERSLTGEATPGSHSTGLVVWCSVLTILFVLLAGSVCFCKYRNTIMFNRDSRLHRASIDLSGTELQSDLLGLG